MRKTIVLIALLLGVSFTAVSQDNAADWKRTRFVGLNYDISTLKYVESDITYNSKFGFAFNCGNTYLLHKKPLAGMIKIGLDALWFDLNYDTYKQHGNGFHIGDDDSGFDMNIGTQKLDIGMGVGPSALIAPFLQKSNELRTLRFGVYFHFTPSVTAIILTDDGDAKAHWGFSPVFNFGAFAQWRMLGVGAEGRWCTANYNGVGADEYDGVSTTEKTKISTSSCRLFVRLCF